MAYGTVTLFIFPKINKAPLGLLTIQTKTGIDILVLQSILSIVELDGIPNQHDNVPDACSIHGAYVLFIGRAAAGST